MPWIGLRAHQDQNIRSSSTTTPGTVKDTPGHTIKRFIREIIGRDWRQHQVELLVGVIQHGDGHTIRHIDAYGL
jgi:hypothetical protein